MTTETTAHDDDFDLLTDDPTAWEVGDVVTVLVSGISVPWGVPGAGNTVCSRGQILRVDRDVLRHREDFLNLVADPAAQLKRWGVQRVARGSLDLERWEQRGDAEWLIARDSARTLANQIVNPDERAEAQREVQRRFGAGLPTSTSTEIRDVGHQRRLADDAAARAQQPTHRILSTAE
jgi:hypothetical protein